MRRNKENHDCEHATGAFFAMIGGASALLTDEGSISFFVSFAGMRIMSFEAGKVLLSQTGSGSQKG